ncbi:hypothetical protein BC941DRAFT_467028 [Chlamydoabsidia padenii]|nr:hypothetical protein BC941DRAFT_467028 [Chlamydoabsidia padenii]
MVGQKTTAKAPESRRSSRTKTMTDFFQKRQQVSGTRKRVTTSDVDSDDNDSNNDSSDEENNHDELDSDEVDSDNEFSLTSFTNPGNSTLASTTTNKKKKATAAKDKKKTPKRRRLENEITMETTSQLLEQVTEQDEASGIYEKTLAEDIDVENLVKTWIETYEMDKINALKNLINYVIRSSGCKMAVTTDAFENEQLILEALELLQTELAKLPFHEYPIISKGSPYRSLKKNLMIFFQTLIKECQNGGLYDGILIETLQSWLTIISAYRPFRHTSTLIALKVTDTLCMLAASNSTLLATTTKQLTTERRKNGSKKTTVSNTLQHRIAQLKKKEEHLNEYINDFFGSVFTHRFRDVEYVIRSECIKGLCDWTILYSDHFTGNEYLRHFGWALNDTNPNVRVESLKAISRLFKNEVVRDEMTSFMQRFVARIEEMALYDVDISVRIQAIGFCNNLYTYNKDWISTATRDAMIKLVTSSNARIRKAVAPFAKSIIDTDIFKPSLDQVETSLAGLTVVSSANDSTTSRPRRATAPSESNKPVANKTWVVFKSVASFLTSLLRNDDNDISLNGALVYDQQISQIIENTVECLWGIIQDLGNYQSMADYLSRDHSTNNSRQQDDDTMEEDTENDELESCYQLTGTEETLLVYVFVICLNKLVNKGSEKVGDKKKDHNQHDEVRNNITEHLIQVLPKLFRKYGGDINRLTQLIQVPQLLNMNMYVELRMENSYKDLLQHLCKLYSTITLPTVLQSCSSSIQHMMKVSLLSESNGFLVTDLQERLVDQFREACHGKDLYTARLTSDDILAITTAMIRLDYLIGIKDITATMDDVSDMKPDVIELMGELADRALLGYEGESQIGQSSLSILFHYLVWRCYEVVEDSMAAADVAVLNKIERRRNLIIEKCLELISPSVDSEPSPEVQKMAFDTLIDIHTLFSSDKFIQADLNQLYLKCAETTQQQLVSFFTSNIKSLTDSSDNDNEEEEDNVESQQERISEFFGTFAHGLAMNVIDVKHGTLLLEHYGEHGQSMDEVVDTPIKVFVEELGTTLIPNLKFTDQICGLYMTSLKKSFERHVDTNYRSIDKTFKLGRLLSQSIKQDNNQPRAQDDIICDRIHLNGIDYSLDKARQANIDDAALTVALKFFKVLILFAKQLNRARDIGKIHKHLEKRLQEYQLKPVDGAKEWEPYFAYVKTLDDLLKKKGFRYDHTMAN